jgi:hypothetical protein
MNHTWKRMLSFYLLVFSCTLGMQAIITQAACVSHRYTAAVKSVPRRSRPTIIAADLNRDGNIDLVTTAEDNGVVSIFPGKGDGTFGNATYYVVGEEPSSIILADFNLDGKADLAVASEDSGTVSILLGKGDGTFEDAAHY